MTTHVLLQNLLRVPVSDSTRNWYFARNCILGFGANFDIKKGINLAKKSSHPDAIWITNLLHGHDEIFDPPENFQDNKVLIKILSTELNDSRALIYSYFYTIDFTKKKEYFENALKMENGLALALESSTLVGSANIQDAKKSALQDEPGGWYLLSTFFAKPNDRLIFLQRAADMNYFEAQLSLTMHYNVHTANCLYWSARLAFQGNHIMKNNLLSRVFDIMQKYIKIN